MFLVAGQSGSRLAITDATHVVQHGGKRAYDFKSADRLQEESSRSERERLNTLCVC